MTIHASCTVVSTGDGIAHQMLFAHHQIILNCHSKLKCLKQLCNLETRGQLAMNM